MEQNIGWNLSRAALSWRHVVDLYMSDLGFTQSRWIAMLHLKRIGEGCTQSELASNIGIEQPSLIRTLNQLCEAGYLQRKESEHDARCKTLWFTSKGKEVLQEMQTIADQGRHALLDGLSDEQRELLNDALLGIITNAQKMSSKH
jgi:MarR family transcriptional regulator for hemolysin